MQQAVVYTLGHSNRGPDELLALLASEAVAALVDVRAQPCSNRFPHFSGERLRMTLEDGGIVYHWAGRQLGGQRNPRPDSRHSALPQTLRGYADYMEGEAFRRAARQLLNMAARAPTAILCAERLPEHCHRRLIADYLYLQGARVVHIIDAGDKREHGLSSEARRESAQLIYDRNSTVELRF